MLRMKRRSFLKLAAATGAVAAIAPRLASAKIEYPNYPQGHSGAQPDMDVGHKWIPSCCLQCHSGCGMLGKVKDGELIKIEGNPYSHNTHDYVIPAGEHAKPGDIDFDVERGALCPKGASGIYTLYNPRRLLHPIKRVGKRGSRKWKRITWEQAYDEIAKGGNLFGEGHVDGLQALHSDAPIDASDSDYMDEAPPSGYGPKKNTFSWQRGRNENAPTTNLLHKNFGTINKGTHWTICEGSMVHYHVFMLGTFAAWDLKKATYAIGAGTNVYDSSFPAQTQGRYLSKWFQRRPGTKYVYVGPRLTKGAGKGNSEWVPIKSGTDPAFALGMIRYIIENNLYKADMISRPNPDAAAAGGYPVATDFTWLVKDSEPREYLRDSDGDVLVSVAGQLMKAKDVTGTADLEGGAPGAKSVFTLYKERAFEKTMDEYNDICGIPRGTIERITREFANADKPTIFTYKGPCQQSNATGVQAYLAVLMLMDRINREGGISGGGGAPHGHVGSVEKVERKGVVSGRAGDAYAGAKPKPTRQWFPVQLGKGGDDVQTECFTGFAMGYPYKVKALWLYRTDVVYTLPRGWQVARRALANIPLVVAVDPFMNETSMLSDYVLPDTTYMEHWGYMHTHPLVKHVEGSVRQPLVGTVDHNAKKHTPINPDTKSVDNIHIEMAMKLGLPNVGPGGAGHGEGFTNDYEFWDLFYDNARHAEHGYEPGHNFSGGLSPDADHIKIGGAYGSSLDRPDLKTGVQVYAYLENVAKTKNALSGKYMDGLPYVGQIAQDGSDLYSHFDTNTYSYQVGTHKDWHHTHARTAENLWLMSLEPENGLEMNPEDAAKYGLKTGDEVVLENPLGETGPYKYKVIVTNTMRPGYGEVKHSYGHWELGSKDIEIEGHEGGGIKGDPRVGAGSAIQPLMLPDPSLEGDSDTINVPCDPVGGSSAQYAALVKIRKA